jgi:hypothetical protein
MADRKKTQALRASKSPASSDAPSSTPNDFAQIAKMIAWDEYGPAEDSWVSNHSCRMSYGCCGCGKDIDRDALAKAITAALETVAK